MPASPAPAFAQAPTAIELAKRLNHAVETLGKHFHLSRDVFWSRLVSPGRFNSDDAIRTYVEGLIAALGGDHTHLCITLDDDVAPADQERLYATYPRSTEPVPLVRQEFIKHLVDVYTETLGGPVDTPTNPNDPNVQLIYGVLGMHLARNPHDSAAILEAAVKGFPGAGVHYPTYHTPPELISGLRLTAPDLAQGGGYHSQFNDTVRAIQLRMKLGDDDLVKHFQPGVKVDDRQSQIFWRSLAHDPSLRCRLQGSLTTD